jgi:glycine C-acetyltransferase
MSARLANDLASVLAELKVRGEYRRFRSVQGGRFPRIILDGQQVLSLCSNNYLGLAEDERVTTAAREALSRYGFGAASSRRTAGNLHLHLELEQRLAAASGCERALLFNSAYMANVGVLTTVLGKNDVVYSDELNHASIIDGCRLSRASVVPYPHCDLSELARLLGEASEERVKLIITDGVFSMEGDVAPLRELVQMKVRYEGALAVDDAHGFGVLGKSGRGSIEHCDVIGRVDIIIGTLGKALGGALGGYVAGSAALVDVLIHRCRNFIYTNPIPPVITAGVLKALDILESEPERRERLWANAQLLRSGLMKHGFRVAGGASPIVPVVVGDEGMAIRVSNALFERRVYVQAQVFPTVPKGSARLRCIVSAAHSASDIEEAVEAFGRVGADLGVTSRVSLGRAKS